MIKKFLKNNKYGIITAVVLNFIFFLYAPLEMFVSNYIDLWFDIYLVIKCLIWVFLLGTILSLLVLFVAWKIKPLAANIISLAFFVAFFSTYIQGNFLVRGLPQLDGSDINWNVPIGTAKSIFVWVVVTAIVIYIVKRFSMEKAKSVFGIASLGMGLMLFLTLIIYTVSSDVLHARNKIVSTENLFEESTDKNFIIFILDSMDTKTFSDLIEKNPEYKETFEDFTYFPNTMSAYGYTRYAIPQLLTGKWYENDSDFYHYNIESFRNAKLIDNMESAGYRCGMYECDMPMEEESIIRFDNVFETKRVMGQYWEFVSAWLRLGAYKYAMFDLKKFCTYNIYEFYRMIPANGDYKQFSADDREFYEYMSEMDTVLTSDKRFKFIHINGAHVPLVLDKNLNNIGEDATYETMVDACITIMKAYIEKLKMAGTFDNSVIVFMADHGYDFNDDNTSNPVARANPFLCIKGNGEKHEMIINQAPISYADLLEAFDKLDEGTTSVEAFPYKEGDARERRFLYYAAFEYAHQMKEYIQKGYAWDQSTMVPTGVEYNQ